MTRNSEFIASAFVKERPPPPLGQAGVGVAGTGRLARRDQEPGRFIWQEVGVLAT